MKFKKYLTEENVISKALALPEPEVGGEYPPEKVKRYLELINKALEAMKNKEENETNDAIVQDLRDKKKKWSNVDKETKPTKTKYAPPPKDDEAQKESKLVNYFRRKL
jgi:hypothetical protein